MVGSTSTPGATSARDGDARHPARFAQPADGARVAVQVEKSPEALLLYLGCLRAGLVYLPLNTAYQHGEIDYFLGNAEPASSSAQPASSRGSQLALRAPGTAHVFTLDDDGSGSLLERRRRPQRHSRAAARRRRSRRDPLHLAAPRGAARARCSRTATSLERGRADSHWGWGSGPATCCSTCCRSSTSTACSSPATARCSTARRCSSTAFDARPRSSPTSPRSTVFMGVPTFYTRLLAEPALDARGVPRMRLFVSGSAPLLAETFERVRASAPATRILERYGMTETGMLTSNPYDGDGARARHGRLPAARRRACASSTTTAAVLRRARSARSRCAGRTSSPATGACRRRRARSSAPTAGSAPATSARIDGRRLRHASSAAPRT